VKLAEIIDINQNEINPTLFSNKEFVYVDIASIENGTGKISLEQKILGKEAPSRARRVVTKGNTIISTVRPNLKAFAYADKEFEDTVFSTGFAILMPKDEKVLLSKLLYIYFMNLDSLMEQILEKMPKGQYPSINKNDIESLKIPLPPIKVQKEIIAECDKIDEEYNTSRMSIETYREKIAEIFDRLEVVSLQNGQGGG
jgi:restriction endonuclease S subunit